MAILMPILMAIYYGNFEAILMAILMKILMEILIEILMGILIGILMKVLIGCPYDSSDCLFYLYAFVAKSYFFLILGIHIGYRAGIFSAYFTILIG